MSSCLEDNSVLLTILVVEVWSYFIWSLSRVLIQLDKFK